MDARSYETPENARRRRLQARRYLRQLDADLPYHTSFLSKRRRMVDRDNLRLMRLVAALAAVEEPLDELVPA